MVPRERMKSNSLMYLFIGLTSKHSTCSQTIYGWRGSRTEHLSNLPALWRFTILVIAGSTVRRPFGTTFFLKSGFGWNVVYLLVQLVEWRAWPLPRHWSGRERGGRSGSTGIRRAVDDVDGERRKRTPVFWCCCTQRQGCALEFPARLLRHWRAPHIT